jgi:hypothetical protein
MDGLGDIFGGLGDMLGGVFGTDGGAEGVMGLADMLTPEAQRERREAGPVVYERYLCGGPCILNINDR